MPTTPYMVKHLHAQGFVIDRIDTSDWRNNRILLLHPETKIKAPYKNLKEAYRMARKVKRVVTYKLRENQVAYKTRGSTNARKARRVRRLK